MNQPVIILLGELMMKSSLVTKQDLDEALQIGKETGMRVGRVLIVSGYLTDEHLNAALEVQTLLKEGQLTLDEGVDALRLVQSKDVSLQSAMNELQIEAAEPRSAA
ncbi:MAG TPA: hypothetical protein V6C81_04075 [Planktothrix sp.]|jgi:hypothetical protein